MNYKAFENSQRQSEIGILFIFLSSLYKSLRGFWVLGLYFLLGKTSDNLIYIFLGIGAIAVLALIFSFLSYRNFKFFINYEKKEFVLQKGVFSSEHISIPFDKIQQVYFKRSVLQRVINVYEVVVDTAGSSKKEISIKALSKEKADALREILMDLIEDEIEKNASTFDEISVEENKKPQKKSISWTYKLSLLSLIKVALTSNYIRGIWLLMIFVGSIQNELSSIPEGEVYVDQATSYMNNNYGEFIQIASVIILFFVAVFLLGVLITFIEVFVKYFGLTLTQTRDSLDLQMGLKTNTRTSLKPKRIQLIREETNPIQRWLNLYQVQLSVASSDDNLAKSNVKIPGLRKEHLEKINYFIFGDIDENQKTYKPHFIWFVRNINLAILPVWIVLGLVNSFSGWLTWPTMFMILGIYGIFVGIFQYLAYKKTELFVSENFIEKKSGVWFQQTERLQLYKLQSVTAKQPFFYKRRNLYNVTFHTAGGDLYFRALPANILRELNYSLYKIETSTLAWM
ncbi:PH domain-containing protein [Mesonia aquimarina]|uniref:PH domain-containing protein n=1 Tax=Mesonia aquimarina TaxID=1504967 RepID=UPI000EF61B2E|nr:PH domain-containing protein [Mesonia aquimarina]